MSCDCGLRTANCGLRTANALSRFPARYPAAALPRYHRKQNMYDLHEDGIAIADDLVAQDGPGKIIPIPTLAC